MKFLKSFHPYAITTIVFWSLAYVFTRLALQYFSPMSLGFLRYGVASLALLIVCMVTKMPPPKKKDILWFVAAGASGFFLYMITFNTGTQYVTAATSSVIIAIAPVLTALLASIVFREKLTAVQWLAIGVEFAGILILTVYGAVLSLNAGGLWLLGAALMLSVYNLIQRKMTRRYSALQSTTYSIFAGTLLLAIFSPTAMGELAGAPPVQLFYIVVLGIFPSAIAYIAWSKAMGRAQRTSQVSNYMFLTPFLTGLLGFLIVGENPDVSTWVGGVFIIAGSLLFQFYRPGVKGERAEDSALDEEENPV